MMGSIIDRRPNPKGKSVPNRTRFTARVREKLKAAATENIANRKIADIGSTKEKVKVRISGTAEPGFHHGNSGSKDYVLPGNDVFEPGDTINKPKSSGGKKGSADGEGDDDFQFTMTREEFLELFFEDMELPDLVKTDLKDMHRTILRRAGHSPVGTPASVNVLKTMRRALGRRIALGYGVREEIEILKNSLKDAIDSEDVEKIRAAKQALNDALSGSRSKTIRPPHVPWIDPIDVRYNRFERVPLPNSSAVMFCLMDVSGSMSETMKDLAKRFFMLLHLFLERKYERVSIVFIRHTQEADEVDEQTFFTDRKTGGTIVSTALQKMLEIQSSRFPETGWNIYVAQASDGDNYESDNMLVKKLLTEKILPLCQYYAYIETRDVSEHVQQRDSDLWKMYKEISDADPRRMSMKKVREKRDVWKVFAELFAKKTDNKHKK
jgi:uncharacterized protein